MGEVCVRVLGVGGELRARFGSSLGEELAWENGGRSGGRSKFGQARSNTLDQRWAGGLGVDAWHARLTRSTSDGSADTLILR